VTTLWICLVVLGFALGSILIYEWWRDQH